MVFNKILVANRGEIACRIIRTAQAMGYATVAVFSNVDVDAPHVRLADQAVRLGAADTSESYLNVDRVLAAAQRAGADALHPGYGFLSEDADFARRVEAAGLVWIGPPPDAIEVMGNKLTAKRAVAAHGVRLVPGHRPVPSPPGSLSHQMGEGEEELVVAFGKTARKLGYPVMVKAAAGGGGRGMRLVDSAENLPAAIASARSEALKAFGSDELLLEKAIVNPRHIEFQVFGDRHGNVIHLGERDCSIQRRHQKVIEEAPSPALSAELRAKMGAASVAAAQAVGYYSAGTVEFLLDENDNFYFIEMNTRLQVEHPVTETVTGLDLVEWMILVADGQALPLTQDEVTFDGHAIEARLYAESAEDNFLPSTGTVWHYQPPSGAGVRVDDGLRSGMAITPHYDAMVAKIITSGATRAMAIGRMRRALEQTCVLGVETNRAFLLDVMANPVFVAGDATTTFVEDNWRPNHAEPLTLAEALAAVVLYQTSIQPRNDGPLAGFSSPVATYCFDTEKRERLTRVQQDGSQLRVSIDENCFEITVLSCDNHELRYEADGLQDVARFAFGDGLLWLQVGAETCAFEDVLLAVVDSAESETSGNITTPMPGSVLRIDVQQNDQVTKGQTLFVLEAMKMEHAVVAPFEGVVEQVLVNAGQQMKSGELVIVMRKT